MRYKIGLPDNYDHNSNGECNECKINVQMLYDGLAWLGLLKSEPSDYSISDMKRDGTEEWDETIKHGTIYAP